MDYLTIHDLWFFGSTLLSFLFLTYLICLINRASEQEADYTLWLMISIYLNSFKKFVIEIHFWNFHSFQNFTISFIQSQDILFMFPQKWKTSVYQVILVFNQFLPMFAMKLLSFDTSASLLICYMSIKPHIDHLRICRCSSMH